MTRPRPLAHYALVLTLLALVWAGWMAADEVRVTVELLRALFGMDGIEVGG